MSAITDFPLVVPVKDFGQTISALAIKRPTGKQIRQHGLPYRVNDAGEVQIHMGVVCAYAAELASVTAGAVDAMDPVDLNKLAWVIAGFFLNSESATPVT
ncbi:phage tail assembly protein [Amantichitinum ursilacus]|uniref:Phage tail protein E n=1 Tax=Amantichitinum ursilacus TaxID=857265 RepID=A0A0N0XKQ2_9NEIS|nr:phage tail assembly protein [Amantichitinum ursilacus]KPC53029.1 hypothetical protein WG78_11080 [Amantichitinum ursilacus]